MTPQEKQALEKMIRDRIAANDPAFAAPTQVARAEFDAKIPDMQAQAQEALAKDVTENARMGSQNEMDDAKVLEDFKATTQSRYPGRAGMGAIVTPDAPPPTPQFQTVKRTLSKFPAVGEQELFDSAVTAQRPLSKDKDGKPIAVDGPAKEPTKVIDRMPPQTLVEPAIAPPPGPGGSGPGEGQPTKTRVLNHIENRKKQQAADTSTTDVKNPQNRQPIDIENWLRLGSNLGGSLTGTGIGKLEPYLKERRAKIDKAMMDDPESEISKKWQARAKLERPEKDWTGIPGSIIMKEFPQENSSSGMSMEDRIAMEELRQRNALQRIAASAGERMDQKKEFEDAKLVVPGFDRVGGVRQSTEEASKFRNMTGAVNNLNSNVDELEKLYKQHGRSMFFGDSWGKASAIIRGMQMQLKDFYGMGAPQTAELKLLEEQISNPTRLASVFTSPESTLAKLNEFKRLIKTGTEKAGAQKGYVPSSKEASTASGADIAKAYGQKNNNVKKISSAGNGKYSVTFTDGTTKVMSAEEMK